MTHTQMLFVPMMNGEEHSIRYTATSGGNVNQHYVTDNVSLLLLAPCWKCKAIDGHLRFMKINALLPRLAGSVSDFSVVSAFSCCSGEAVVQLSPTVISLRHSVWSLDLDRLESIIFFAWHGLLKSCLPNLHGIIQ